MRAVYSVATSQQDGIVASFNAGRYQVRGVVTANIAALATFTVAGNDGLTYAAGESLLAANQTTVAECGIYVVGTVSGGTAPLTRRRDYFTGQVSNNGAVVEVSEGTIWRGSSWKSMATGTVTIGTNDPVFYPRTYMQVITLVAGTVTINTNLFLFSATTSMVGLTLNTPNTTANTVTYCAVAASRVAGKAGTGTIIARANIAAGTINVADVSTLDMVVTNW